VVAVSAPIPPVPGPPQVRELSAESTVAALRAEVAELDRLADLPVGEHVARYDALHGTLSDALAAIDGV
jgi:hypothetical protein